MGKEGRWKKGELRVRREGKEKEKVERERKWRDGAGRRKRGRDDNCTSHCSL